MDFPFTPGYDISGVVDAVGDDVSDFQQGDAVFAVNWGEHKHDDESKLTAGGLAQYVVLPASKLSKKPEGISHEQAAAVALVGSTAHQALDNLGVTKGSKVLILGGAGAVGTVACQLAKLRGAWVATTCSPRTKDYVIAKSNPDLIVDYTSQKWDEDVPQLKGIDAVFVAVATFDAGFVPTAHQPAFTWAAFMCLKNDPKQQDELVQLMADKKLTLDVEETFPFTSEGVQAAFAKQKGGKSKGKNVIVL